MGEVLMDNKEIGALISKEKILAFITKHTDLLLGFLITVVFSVIGTLLVLSGRFFYNGIILSGVINDFAMSKDMILDYTSFSTEMNIVFGIEYIIIIVVSTWTAYLVVKKNFATAFISMLIFYFFITLTMQSIYGTKTSIYLMILILMLIFIAGIFFLYYKGVAQLSTRYFFHLIVMWFHLSMIIIWIFKDSKLQELIIASILILLFILPEILNILLKDKDGKITGKNKLKITIFIITLVSIIILKKSSVFTLHSINIFYTSFFAISIFDILLITPIENKVFKKRKNTLKGGFKKEKEASIKNKILNTLILLLLCPIGILFFSSFNLSYSLGALFHADYIQSIQMNELLIKNESSLIKEFEKDLNIKVKIVAFDIIGTDGDKYNVLFVLKNMNNNQQQIELIKKIDKSMFYHISSNYFIEKYEMTQ